MPALYKQVSTYYLLARGKRLSPLSSTNADKNLARLDLQFSWTTQTGKGEYGNQVILAVPVTPKVAPHGIGYSNAEIEKVGVLQLFDDPEGSFGALVAKAGVITGRYSLWPAFKRGVKGSCIPCFSSRRRKT